MLAAIKEQCKAVLRMNQMSNFVNWLAAGSSYYDPPSKWSAPPRKS